MAHMEKKENTFNLSFLNISGRKLRYVIVGPSDELNVETPLFLGIDLLSQSGIAKSNQCRIHSRYSKKGLATKMFFPEGVAMCGISNCQSGVWFYNVQGVFKLIFEHQNRQCQLKLASVLFDVWRSPNACPNLPERIDATLTELRHWQDSSLFHASMRRAPNVNEEDTDFNDPEELDEQSWSCEEDDNDDDEPEFVLPDDPPAPPSPQPDAQAHASYSLWWLTGDIIHRVEAHGRTCPSKEKFLTRALVSFLKLVCDASKLYSIRDGVLTSFFKLIVDYASLSHNSSKMRHFGTSWGIVDARQNALLCLVSEWLGKYMNSFGDAISERVLKFKTENLDLACDLPPAEIVVHELFPECMRLLIGYWTGMYESRSQTVTLDGSGSGSGSGGQHKHRLLVKHDNRADHSYFSQKENCAAVAPASASVTATAPTTTHRADHSYFSPSSIASNDRSDGSTYDDHTYKAKNGKIMQVSTQTSRRSRKDHTYVTKRDAAVDDCDASSGAGAGASASAGHSSPPHSKRLRSSHGDGGDDGGCGCGAAMLVNNSKHSVVQLVLEFLNNSLISGVAHVVYTRLLNL